LVFGASGKISAMKDYVIVIQRDAKGGERDVKDWRHGFIRAIRIAIRQNPSFSGRFVRGMIVRGMAKEVLRFYSPDNHSSDTSGLSMHHPSIGCGLPRCEIRGSLPELDHGFHGIHGFATQSAPKNSS